MKLYYDDDADLKYLSGKTVAILGYGSQGHAHALNLKDNNVNVVVGLREDSSSREKAEKAGLEVRNVSEASELGDIIMVLLPDQWQGEIYKKDILPHLKPGKALAFAHGFAVHFKQIMPQPDVDVFMVAPKGPGHLVRRVFEEGGGVPCLVAIHKNASGNCKNIALAYAKGIGGMRAGVIETTFKEETETDLFGEQAVLCGGVTELIKAGYETLVEAGYQPEIAYFECLHELKLIVDLLYEGGISGMYYSVSDTAEYGGMSKGKVILNDSVKQRMKMILKNIQDGSFAREWIEENRSGQKRLEVMRDHLKNLEIEQTGKELRKMMQWINNGR